MKEVLAKDFNVAVKDGHVLVDFYGTGCGNCKMMEPILAQLEAEHKDINFIKVNIHGNPNLAEEHDITTLPTLIFFNKGKAVEKIAGVKPKTLIKKKIAEIYQF